MHMTRVFGAADKPEDCVAGTLNTKLPIKVGQVHKIKDRKWKCEKISLNHIGETLGIFKPAK